MKNHKILGVAMIPDMEIYRNPNQVINKNAKQLIEAGADVLVAESYVFGAIDPTATVADLKKLTCF